MKDLLLISALGLCLGLNQAAFAGDALDSVIKCENVKGGTKKKGLDGNLFTVYVRSEGDTRDAKVDIIATTVKTTNVKTGQVRHFPSSSAKLVNSWLDLNEAKAWFMALLPDGSLEITQDSSGNIDGKVVLYVKVKQKQGSNTQTPEMVYMGLVESKKESGFEIYDKAVSCQCGEVAARGAGTGIDYSTWKQTVCTPNSK